MVVRITVKNSRLTAGWGRNITDNLTQKEKGYQITVDPLKSVVYAQPDSERFYDMSLQSRGRRTA